MKTRIIGGGLLIIFGLSSIVYHVSDTIELSHTIPFHGVMREPVVFSHSGGDYKHDYAELQFLGHPEKFYARDCAYDQMRVEKLKALQVGDSLFVLTKDRWAALADGPGDVVEIRSATQGLILSFGDYAKCHNNPWSFAMFVGIGLVFFGIIRLSYSDADSDRSGWMKKPNNGD